MKKSDLIKMLNEIPGDYEVMILSPEDGMGYDSITPHHFDVREVGGYGKSGDEIIQCYPIDKGETDFRRYIVKPFTAILIG